MKFIIIIRRRDQPQGGVFFLLLVLVVRLIMAQLTYSSVEYTVSAYSAVPMAEV